MLNQLYKHTQLQETFGAIMLALVDGAPKMLSLRQIIHHYLEHQKDVSHPPHAATTWTRPRPRSAHIWRACLSRWITSTRLSR